MRIKDGWIGFNNGIYKIPHKRSSSGILLLQLDDGIVWKDIFEKPIIYPTKGWKKSFIYQLDVKKVGSTYYLFYNAREGWIRGWEGIGLATLKNNSTK